MSNINDVPMVMVLLLFFKVWTCRTDVRTDSHMATKSFDVNGLPNFPRYGAPPACLRRAGAPLKILCASKCFLANLRFLDSR